MDKRGEVGGTWNFKCNFCGESRNGSYSRVKVLLLQVNGQGIDICKKVTQQDKIEMTRVEEEFERKKKESRAKDVLLPCQSQSQSELNYSSKKWKYDFPLILRAFDISTRNQLDQEIARMFFIGGLPFNLARNPYYLRSYPFAANNSLSGYIPLGYNKKPMLRCCYNQSKELGKI